MKNYIGVLDMGFEGLITLEGLSQQLKCENFIYINDVAHTPYEGKTPEEIIDLVSKNVARLLKYDIKALVVVSDTIVEYCLEYLNSLNIEVVNIVNSVIDYVNDNYEQKNLVLMAKKAILDANLYQKNFKYNHLYNINCDNLNDIIENKQVKTAESFNAVSSLLKTTARRNVDVVINSSPYLILLKTEVAQFIKCNENLNVGEVLGQHLKTKLLEKGIANPKGRGKKYIYLKTNEVDYMKKCKRYCPKCKFLDNF